MGKKGDRIINLRQRLFYVTFERWMDCISFSFTIGLILIILSLFNVHSEEVSSYCLHIGAFICFISFVSMSMVTYAIYKRSKILKFPVKKRISNFKS
ncbi:hypothetical protein NPIL_517561 [Nephila pilipes]|uniref:Uncharacterized protein n=1 Tax=Nephila pilipes TaxID=299642 RepID=A0A8X6US07_NEPPI|nr:hypothetical protein NPIL_517561 [Nephila pilipes]